MPWRRRRRPRFVGPLGVASFLVAVGVPAVSPPPRQTVVALIDSGILVLQGRKPQPARATADADYELDQQIRGALFP
jgi:hypothetical protein